MTWVLYQNCGCSIELSTEEYIEANEEKIAIMFLDFYKQYVYIDKSCPFCIEEAETV